MKLTKKQTEQVAVLATKFDTTAAAVTAKFNEILVSKKLASRDPKTRSQIAMRMLLASLSSANDKKSFGGVTEDVIIRVEQKEEPTEFKRADGEKGYRSSVYCTASADGKSFFTVLTLWGDANENNPNMVIGTTYSTKAVKNGNQLSMNNPETLTEVEDKLPPMSEVITNSYPVVELENLELNISTDWNDLKLIKGIISGSWTTKTRNDTMMGFLKIISEDGDISMVAKFGRIYSQVDLWDDGSLVYVLGQVTPAVYDEESGEIQYEASAWGNLVIPIDAFEKVVENDTDEDEDFDVEDDDDEFDDEDFGLDDDDDEDWG